MTRPAIPSQSAPHLIRGIEAAAELISDRYFPCTARYVKQVTGTKPGDLPYYKVAGRRHYDPADIDAWVRSRRLAPPA